MHPWMSPNGPSPLANSGLGMRTEPLRLEEFRVFRRPAFAIGLALGLAAAAVPGLAQAQTNIDQGKSAAEIFANDCATCHKGARGLANGQNSLTLSAFLREHYTASREQAATMAAYVLGAGGDSAPARGQKPGPEHARATVEEPKTTEPKLTEPKITEPKLTEPKTANPLAEPGSSAAPRPGLAARETRPVPSRGHKQEPEAAPSVREPAAAAVAPAANETPGPGETPNSAEVPNRDNSPTTSAAAPADSQPGDSAPVPRDDIPD